MKKIILFFTIIASNYYCNAQSINDNWILGNNLINFDNQNVTIGTPPVILVNDAGARSIVSNENGELLFYLANDNKLYDKNGVVLGTLPITSNFERNIRQNSLIFPNPVNKNELIGVSSNHDAISNGTGFNNYLTYRITFSDPNYPNGKLVSGSIQSIMSSPYTATTGYSSLSATKKNDDSGYYLILGSKVSTNPVFLIKDYSNTNFPSSLQSYQVVSLPSGLIPNTFNPTHTLSKISSDGFYFAFLLSNQTHNYVFLADFDNIMGSLSNFRFVKYSNNTEIKDIEFSANSSVLYMLTGNEISARNVINFNTNEKILVETNPIEKSSFQRATNGEIYILDWHEDTNWQGGYTRFASEKIYKIDNSNDIVNASISTTNFLLNTPIEIIDAISSVPKTSLFTIPELVENKIYCPLNIDSKTTDITESVEINISALNQINLKHLVKNVKGIYTAGNDITLSNGFNIKSGSDVIFKIDDCSTPLPKALNKTTSNENDNNQVFSVLDKEIRVYPNPFIDFINLDLGNYVEDYFSVIIYDTNGRKIKNYNVKGGQLEQLNCSELSAGIYILKVFNEKIQKEFKLIKK